MAQAQVPGVWGAPPSEGTESDFTEPMGWLEMLFSPPDPVPGVLGDWISATRWEVLEVALFGALMWILWQGKP